MEPEVKERLVGAIILVLLAVLVVPALLSGPRQPGPVEPPASASPRSVEIELAGARGGDAGEAVALDDPSAMPEAAPVRDAPTGVPDAEGPVPAASAAAGAPAVASEPAPLPAAVPDGVGWAVQIAALSTREAAAARVADLQRRGYSAFIFEYRTAERVLYRVRVGPADSRERALALAARLQGEGVEGNVVRHP